MKKTALLLIVLCLVLSCFSGCSGKTQNAANDDPVAVSTDPPQEDAPEEADKEAEKEAAEDTPKAPEKEKIVLKLGGVGCTESKIKMVINEFNKTDSDYTISLMDYGFGTTPDQGKLKLQTQIMAGNAPDMLLFDKFVCFSSGDMSNALSPLAYIGGGALLDLDEYIKNDPELNPDDFIIWDALHEFGGMYVIGPTFWADGLCCLPETAEQYEGWSFEDYLALQDSLTQEQDLIYGIDPQFFLRRVTSGYLSELIDIENATCSFDQPEFISMLETACHVNTYNTQEKHLQADNSFKSAPEMLVNGELLFYHASLYSLFDVSFDRYRAGVRQWNGEGENPYDGKLKKLNAPLGYMGYPTPDGSNGALIDFPYTVGICAGTEQADGCWEFIRYMLQNQFYHDTYDGTPVLYEELDDCLAYLNAERPPWESTQADLDQLVTFAEKCDKMAYLDLDVLSIVEEEAAEMLAGKKSADDAAKMIQNRASVLVMERYG